MVACPGRLEDLIATGDVMLDHVAQVVIDEADRMADMGFLPAVRRILAGVRAPRQVQLFSATLNGAVGKLVAEVQSSPARHEVGPLGPDIALAQHVFWNVVRAERTTVAAAAIRSMGSTIVFCRTRHGADRLTRQLVRGGTTAAAIHGGLSQPQRDRALRAFSRGEVGALVATDVAARGVHVDDVAGVIHFDLPADGDTYVHRSGRTARAGAAGTVVTFVDPAARRDATALQREAGIDRPITEVDYGDLVPVAPGVAAAPVTARLDADRAGRARGTVKFFHRARGYGFIEHAAGSDVFVHQSNLPEGVRIDGGEARSSSPCALVARAPKPSTSDSSPADSSAARSFWAGSVTNAVLGGHSLGSEAVPARGSPNVEGAHDNGSHELPSHGGRVASKASIAAAWASVMPMSSRPSSRR